LPTQIDDIDILIGVERFEDDGLLRNIRDEVLDTTYLEIEADVLPHLEYIIRTPGALDFVNNGSVGVVALHGEREVYRSHESCTR
jgi:hypothetical protein